MLYQRVFKQFYRSRTCKNKMNINMHKRCHGASHVDFNTLFNLYDSSRLRTVHWSMVIVMQHAELL